MKLTILIAVVVIIIALMLWLTRAGAQTLNVTTAYVGSFNTAADVANLYNWSSTNAP